MKRIFFYSLIFISIGFAYKFFIDRPEQEVPSQKIKIQKNKEKQQKPTMGIPQKDNRIIQENKQEPRGQEPILIEDSLGQQVSYDPNDLVSCETQIGNCLPKPEPEPEDPNANTFCITYESNCNSQASIQRKWNEEEVFKQTGDDVNPETIPRDSPNILDEYNKNGLESMRERRKQAQNFQINNKNQENNENSEELDDIPDYSNEQQEEY